MAPLLSLRAGGRSSGLPRSLPAGTWCCLRLLCGLGDSLAKQQLLERERFSSLQMGLIPNLLRYSKAVLLLLGFGLT